MTNDEREELLTTLHGLGKSIEGSGDERGVATTNCLYALTLAIRQEVELARHILLLDGDEKAEFNGIRPARAQALTIYQSLARRKGRNDRARDSGANQEGAARDP